MPTVTRRGGEEHLEISKAETRRILEATYIVLQIGRNAPDCPDAKEFVTRARYLVRKYGAKHLDEQGELKEPERRKAVDDSVPTNGASSVTQADAANS